MSLVDVLNNGPTPDARRFRMSHPTGFAPGIKFDASNNPSEVNIVVKQIPQDEKAWRGAIKEATGLDAPLDREVRLDEVRYWGDPDKPMIYARFKFAPLSVSVDQLSVKGLLKDLRKNRKKVTPLYDGDATFVLDFADWQLGKKEGGGTAATITRIDLAIEAAIQRAKELKKINRSLGKLVIIGGGDIIEGCFIFPNQAFEIDSDRRTQLNVATTLILDAIDRLAPHFSEVVVLVVGGNHGQHRVDGNRVNRFDNDDCLVFENAARAADRDPRLSHVKFVIAQDEPAKTLNVNGHILGATHGDAYGKTAGTSIEVKVRNWFAKMAAGRQPIGDSDLLVTHHFHHLFYRDWGSCLWIQAPAMDGGSPHFTDFSGQDAAPGMLSFVITPESRLLDMQIL